ncbi:MAG: thioredoxin family protein [Chromatiales bacterium]|nr:thioredoxin family protein [Chromatiales bacterium]
MANATAAADKRIGVDIELEKVGDIVEVMGYGMMSTPRVLVNN